MQQLRKTRAVQTVASLGLLGYLSTGAIAVAQVTVFEGLPPTPPAIPTLRGTPEDSKTTNVVVPIDQPPSLREFNFEAPTAVVNPNNAVNYATRYRVEVANSDSLMLAAVKKVEPNAFLRGDRIQVGLFSEQQNANSLRTDLQAKGIAADVVAVGGNSPVAAIGSSIDSVAGYFVAIPTRGLLSSDLQSQLRQAGINPNLMQERDAPRGNHIAIGPFTSRQEAESINTQMRAISFDSRLYFQD
ncbi:hypothetical protein [[Limnothrix rosea] IAM M-220]|uniref:hypothetical protein n=1 Tax=[Limnothrix rosea] IAM M-220 TaxID=454133 RepID=UPI000965100F|nr:hypothetical protein [[Limnothrix rosea] IAM M-220]OKH11014.1 hypothetical protein NIES208_17860 [[Limnothrix rosea] IAM M-220]